MVQVELATLVDSAPEGDEWLHEMKFDGYRIVARLADGRVNLFTRGGHDWTEKLPTLKSAMQRLPVHSAIVDGEFVALDANGLSSFQTLQNQLSLERDNELFYYAFDLLYLDGLDLRSLPLIERKRRLHAVLGGLDAALGRRIKYSDHVLGNGPQFFHEACSRSLEGIVSKRVNSVYRGARTRDWLKVKCTKRQEFIIVGFTDPTGSRSHFGSLLLALRRERALVYAGRVGTGFTEQSLRDLHQRLVTRLEPRLSLDNAPRDADTRDVHWVRPDLVAEVQFLGMTEDGLLRHASFQGLREDKQPGQVQLELPQKSPAPAASVSKAESRSRTSKSGHVSGASGESMPHSELFRSLTHSNKVIYPEMGVTKQELGEYYAAIATHMLPHVAKRPLTLVRCPNGRDKACFFQKHPGQGTPDAIKAVMVREKEGKAPYAVVDDVAGLIALVQLAVLEIHTWGSHADTPTKPDLLVFDLDPDVDLPFEEVIRCAKRTRRLFEGLGLESFVKTTGGKGLHVCVPILPDLDWDEVKAFCRRVAQEIVKQQPDKYLDVANKSKRKGKIYVDYLRNARGATFIAPYSTRAREGAPIATPLEWDELSPRLVPAQFNLRTLAQRLAKIGSDPFARMQSLHQRLRP